MAPKKRSPQVRKSWQGRLKAQPNAATAKLLASLDVDQALWRYDIVGSLAHAEMLARVGLLTSKELAAIRKGLTGIARDLKLGRLKMPVELEDIHMVVEKVLIDRIGPVGGKLHTGRSRNDQVATDLRLWARYSMDDLAEGIQRLQRAMVALARRQGRVVMPAYTHLQRAQPIAAGHAMLAYVEMLQRDADRLADARRRANVCPLGSGAVAGTSLPLDRRVTAAALGFAEISRNSIDATSDRDFLAELCFCCALLAVHMSRWAEDWILYSTAEFGLLELPDAYCTSSSMMPQKKNADTLELIRAKAAAAIGQLTGLLTLLKGLPLAYNRDLQDDKRFVFATVWGLQQALDVAAGLVATTKLNAKRIAQTLEDGFLDATALAEYLVRKDVPFRQAHKIVAGLVAKAERAGRPLSKLPLADFQAACDKVSRDVYGYLGAENVVKHYATEGAAGHRQLRDQLAFWTRKLKPRAGV
jgi:argininosuccinate lyase